jgi:hypothetical protein
VGTDAKVIPLGMTADRPDCPTVRAVAARCWRWVVQADVKLDSPVSALVAGWNDAGFELLREQPVADKARYACGPSTSTNSPRSPGNELPGTSPTPNASATFANPSATKAEHQLLQPSR